MAHRQADRTLLKLTTSKWPKCIPPLTPDQKVISDDFMKLWHETLPRFRMIEDFNHGWVSKYAPSEFRRSLEFGAGLGEHLLYERLSAEQEAGYVTVELRETWRLKSRGVSQDPNGCSGLPAILGFPRWLF
jgi:hypothetical protein